MEAFDNLSCSGSSPATMFPTCNLLLLCESNLSLARPSSTLSYWGHSGRLRKDEPSLKALPASASVLAFVLQRIEIDCSVRARLEACVQNLLEGPTVPCLPGLIDVKGSIAVPCGRFLTVLRKAFALPHVGRPWAS